MTHVLIEDIRNSFRANGYLPMRFRTLDGSDVAEWLSRNGYDVIHNEDTGRNGLARTDCGAHVSTNGYVCFPHLSPDFRHENGFTA